MPEGKHPDNYVLTVEANGSGTFGNIYLVMNSVYSATYIAFKIKNKKEGISLMSYLNSYLIRFMLKMRKNTQHIPDYALYWIPLIEFTKEYTDADIYKQFKISKTEQEMIEQLIGSNKGPDTGYGLNRSHIH